MIRIKWPQWLVLAISILFSTVAGAQAPSDQDFFNPPYDRAAEMMRGLFGDAWLDAAFDGGVPAAQSGDPVYRATTGGIDTQNGGLLGVIVEILSLAALAFTGVIIFSTFGSGLANSMYEGVAMGRNYHGFWVPLRSCMSLFFLIPWSSGYTYIYWFFFKIIAFSLATVSIAYNAIIGFMASGHSLANLPSTQSAGAWGTAVESMVGGEGCKALQNAIPNSEGAVIQRIEFVTSRENPNGAGVMAYTATYRATPASDSVGAICGSMTYKQQISDDPQLRPAEQSLFNCKITALEHGRQLAANLAGQVMNGGNVSHYSIRQISADIRGQIEGSCIPSFNQRVMEIAGQGNNQTATDAHGHSRGTMFDVLRDNGWLYAGSFYFTISSTLSKRAAAVGEPPEVTAMPMVRFGAASDGEFEREFSARYSPIESLITSSHAVTINETNAEAELASRSDALSSAEGTDNGSTLKNTINSLTAGMVEWGTKHLYDGNDVLVSLAESGHSFVNTFWVLKGITLVGGAASSFIPGAGAVLAGAFDTLDQIGLLVLAIGVWMAFWLPATPWLLWISSITSWVCSLVLSVFSLPVFAMAHAFPEGEGWGGQQARNGYMLTLSAAVSPILNLGGFVAGMLVVQMVGWVILGSSSLFVRDLIGHGTNGLISGLAFIVIIGAAIGATANKAFDLSFEARDSILKWIGGGVEQLGDRSTLDRTNALIAAVAARGAGAVGGGRRQMGMGAAGRDGRRSAGGGNVRRPASSPRSEGA